MLTDDQARYLAQCERAHVLLPWDFGRLRAFLRNAEGDDRDRIARLIPATPASGVPPTRLGDDSLRAADERGRRRAANFKLR